jgi:hypothetical protein
MSKRYMSLMRTTIKPNFLLSLQVDFLNAFMITTIEGGHNSGRIYYLQASSKDQCNELVKSLKTLAKRASERANAQTRFAKVQLMVRKAFNSYWFQTTSAGLIILVMLMFLNLVVRCISSSVVLAELPGEHLRGAVRPQDDARRWIFDPSGPDD